MPLFQNSVVTKYLNTQDKNTLTHKWDLYKNLFLNPTKQNNIRNSKEEQYQEGFLRELFVQILGYTINPDLNFNLTTELKNEKDSKKADGGIIVDGKVFGVIELKGTNTTDLNKIETQAFGYKNNQKDCVYVITSNFEKLRFYIDNAIEHIEFNLFTLTEDEFQLLYLCLGFDNLSQNIAKRIKEESLSEEDMITKKLYKDYSLFKRELHQNLVLLNPDFQPLELFKKSQKLLDRFLFLFFAEDRQLLPPNSVRLILNQWKQIQELDLDEDVQLYSRFKKYFGYLNTGHKGKQHDVFAYNGGLFKPDEILDVIQIDDDLLYKHTLKLSEYDFASEVDVNILGHIFENSLNELDEIKAQLDPTREYDPLPKNQTKRKKDGVFYTPKYITKYIVENTLGKLCTEKKQEIEIIEEDYYLTREHAPLPKQTSLSKKKKQELLEKLTQYRNWLLQLTICDPACGSGAFLNEALNFLIAEHSYIDELQAKLFGDALVLSDVENSILENNLFGVDINEESVEIAKLSLWLRTAQPNRKLNDLTGNIKCGNSLIDDEAVAGEKAFNWQKEFPTVFKEKHKKPFHITWVTHNSRISQRMIDNKVKLSEAYWLEDEQEIMVAQTIKEIVEQDELNVMAFNICGDHIHILLVCEEEEIPNIIRKLKGKSSQKLKEYLQIPKEEQFTLWAQKYSTTYIDSEDQLWNTVEYIRNNRRKHGLDTSNKGQLPLASHSDSKLPLASSSIGSINKGLQPLVAVTTSSSLSQSYDHAFRTEYKGGFDVVIGNPPYVQIQSMGNVSNDLEKSNFQTFEKTGDLYCLFYELGNIVLNNNGLLGFITSNKWLRANYGKSLRNYLIKNTQPLELLDLGSGIFESATVDSNLLIFKKTKNNNNPFVGLDISKEKTFTDFSIYESQKVEINVKEDEIWTISNPIEQQIKQKIETIGTPLKDWDVKFYRGTTTGYNDAFLIDESLKNKLESENINSLELIKPLLKGRDLMRYIYTPSNYYIITTYPTLKIQIQKYPAIEKHLSKFLPSLNQTGEVGCRKKTNHKWFEYSDTTSYFKEFEKEKIIFSKASKIQAFCYDDDYNIVQNTGYILTGNNLKYFLSFLNSKLAKYIFLKFYQSGGIQGEITIQAIENIPIPKICLEIQQPFIEKADLMLRLNKELQLLVTKFMTLLQSDFTIKKPTKKLENWYNLSWAEFEKELNKLKITLLGTQKEDWLDRFTRLKTQAISLKTEIDQTDKQIDAMVYELYGLTDEEIKIIENI